MPINLKKHSAMFFLLFLSLAFSLVSCSKINGKSSLSTTLDPNKIFVNYIDVGQGDSILIQVNNRNLLIDAGPTSSKDSLIKYLKKISITKLDYVIATHPHEDHIGGMDKVITTFPIGKFYSPKVMTNTKTFDSMLSELKNKNLKINVIRANMGSDIDLGENTKVEVFSPTYDKYENLNNYSPIIKVTYKNNSFLFVGDAEKLVEKEVLQKNYDINADVLKVGHHGSTSSTSKEFLEKVSPSIAVISVGAENDYGHPHKETLKLLQDYNVKTYRTDKDGTIIICSDGKSLSKK